MSVTVIIIGLLALTLPRNHMSAQACENGKIRTVERRANSQNLNFVQYCSGGQWRWLCTGMQRWRAEEAIVACRQLGYSGGGPRVGTFTLEQNDPKKFFRLASQCIGNEDSMQECGGSVVNLMTCGRNRGAVQCFSDCANGEIRLVGGSTSREGRVDMCMNECWRTVCNDGEGLAAKQVCSHFGLPAEGAAASTILKTPLEFCTILMRDGTVTCNPGTCMPSHSLGVVCKSHQDVINKTVNEIMEKCSTEPASGASTDTTEPFNNSTDSPTPTPAPYRRNCSADCAKTTSFITEICDCETKSSTQPQTCPPATTTTECECETNPNATSSDLTERTEATIHPRTDCTAGSTVNGQANEREGSCVSVGALGGVAGILVAILVLLIIGWILTCVVLVNKNQNKTEYVCNPLATGNELTTIERELDNPVYDTATEDSNYGSRGPKYEQVDLNVGAVPTYDVIDHGNSSANPSQRLKPDNNYSILECDRHEGKVGRCDGVPVMAGEYEVPLSEQNHNKGCPYEEEYSTLKH